MLGKKIGVPGLGAFLHVTFRAWLKLAGVDWKKVNFVEAPFPQHGDLLRGRGGDVCFALLEGLLRAQPKSYSKPVNVCGIVARSSANRCL